MYNFTIRPYSVKLMEDGRLLVNGRLPGAWEPNLSQPTYPNNIVNIINININININKDNININIIIIIRVYANVVLGLIFIIIISTSDNDNNNYCHHVIQK
jgi:hypothetical protein